MIYFCTVLQVDDTPPSVSRSGKPIDLFASGPISSIGHNAPTLAAIVHRGIRLKKVTTRITQTPPSVAASTLAQAFKVTVKPLHLYRSYFHMNCICIHKFLFFVTANQCIGKNQEPKCRCPPIQPAKEKGCQEYQGRNKAPESGNCSSSSGISHSGGIFSFSSRSRDPASTISPSNARSTTGGRTSTGRTPTRSTSARRHTGRCGRTNYRPSRFNHIGSFFDSDKHFPSSR